MTTFDVNLSILFTELPLLERPAAAKAAGFDHVEFWWPFASATPAGAEIDAFVTALTEADVQLVGLNFAAGDMPGGDRGLLSWPERAREFRDNIDVTVAVAEATGCTALNALYGNRIAGLAPEAQDEVALENLRLAAKAAERIGATVLIEALNSIESPRYPLDSTESAIAVIDAAGAGNVAFLADLYHLARMGERPADVIDGYADRFGHVQIADTPGRNQPGTGDLDFPGIFSQLRSAGYHGFIGLEYKPTGTSAASFDWIKGVTA